VHGTGFDTRGTVLGVNFTLEDLTEDTLGAAKGSLGIGSDTLVLIGFGSLGGVLEWLEIGFITLVLGVIFVGLGFEILVVAVEESAGDEDPFVFCFFLAGPFSPDETRLILDRKFLVGSKDEKNGLCFIGFELDCCCGFGRAGR